jgi:hypothetical protein
MPFAVVQEHTDVTQSQQAIGFVLLYSRVTLCCPAEPILKRVIEHETRICNHSSRYASDLGDDALPVGFAAQIRPLPGIELNYLRGDQLLEGSAAGHPFAGAHLRLDDRLLCTWR